MRVDFHPEALQELAASVDFYNERVAGLGDEFLDFVESFVRQIESDPFRAARYEAGTHRYVLQRFPFTIIYRNQTERILIVAFAHPSRRPAFWRHRK